MEKYVDSIVPHLIDAGLDVTVVTRHFNEQTRDETLQEGRLRVVRVPWIPGFLSRNPTFNWNARKAARMLDFDAVLCNGIVASRMGFELRKELGRAFPMIARPAGIAFNQPQYQKIPFLPWWLRRQETEVYGHADAVVFNSQNEKQSFQTKLGFVPAQSRVIPTGVDVGTFSKGNGALIRKQLHLANNEKMVLFVGRLLSVKGADVLVKAATSLPPNVRVVIAGVGPQKPQLDALVRELNLDKPTRVTFVGHQNYLPDWLAAADAFVLPSRSEGLPLALLEAMAASKPCVVTDIGLPVQDGKTAIVVPSEMPGALALGIQKALTPAGKAIGKRAQAYVRANFSWPKAARAYAWLVNILIKNKLSVPK